MWNYADGFSPEENKQNAEKMKSMLEELTGLIDGIVELKVQTGTMPSSKAKEEISPKGGLCPSEGRILTTDKFMEMAIQEANDGVKSGHGGPFGAVIVRDGKVVYSDHNRVLLTNDPTMHAEVAAIRGATAALGRFSLHDCEIYSTCMPCPMCLGAIMWAKIPKLYYGLSAADAAAIGFDDDYIYDFIKSDFARGDKLILQKTDTEMCRELFTNWQNRESKKMY
jgi:guanine deaminase